MVRQIWAYEKRHHDLTSTITLFLSKLYACSNNNCFIYAENILVIILVGQWGSNDSNQDFEEREIIAHNCSKNDATDNDFQCQKLCLVEKNAVESRLVIIDFH